MSDRTDRLSHTWVTPRSPATVLVLCVVTCGLYQLFWYHHIYEETVAVAGETPTGNGYWLDLLLTVITCGVYGVFVDYKLCNLLNGVLQELGHRVDKNESTVVVVLDVSAYLTGWMANLVTTALAQDQLNKILSGPLVQPAPR